MSFSSTNRKYIFIGVILIVIIGLFIAYFLGKKQDQKFAHEDALYNALVQHLQEEKYEDSLIIADNLKKQQQESEILNYAIALAAANTGEFEKAVSHMQRTMDFNPHKVEDSMFMLQYAEMLLFAEREADAKIVLERCTTLPIPETYPQYEERIQQLLSQING